MKVNDIDKLQDFIESLEAPVPRFSDIKSKFCLLQQKVSTEDLENFEAKVRKKDDINLDTIMNSLEKLKQSYEIDYKEFVIKEKVDTEVFKGLRTDFKAMQNTQDRFRSIMSMKGEELIDATENIMKNFNFNIDISNLNTFITVVDYEIRYRSSLKRMEEEVISGIDKDFEKKVTDIIKRDGQELLEKTFFTKNLKNYGFLILIIVTISGIILAGNNWESILKFVKVIIKV